jgi:Bacterial regulatory proteins, gntR family
MNVRFGSGWAISNRASIRLATGPAAAKDGQGGQSDRGELLPGDQVPWASELAATHGVSRGTALRALGVLREEGLITTTPGWGSFVAGR